MSDQSNDHAPAVPTPPAYRKIFAKIKRIALDVEPRNVPSALAQITRLCIDAGAASPSERNWTEDASHENGNYECLCCECDQLFIGHKRRVVCKACSNLLAAPPVRSAASTVEPVAWQITDDNVVKSASVTLDSGVADIWRKAGGTVRPLYAAPTVSPEPAKAACPHCDDTGDVHRADGEWLGSCGCKSPEPDAVREALEEICQYTDMRSGNGNSTINKLANDALAALSRPAHGGWEDISTAPSDGRRIWVYGGRNIPSCDTEADGEWWRRMAAEGNTAVPTHWMEYSPPAPPTAPRNDRGSEAQ